MLRIKGMTWDHVRGIAPLREASKQYNQLFPDIEITWDARSLKDFEDYPIELLANQYDILLIDHPFVGTGVKKKALVPINEFVEDEFIREQERNSVGKSYQSYLWDNQNWALAVDAASQVSVYREDLMRNLGLKVPKTWDEVLCLIKVLPGTYKVGIPLNPTHCYLTFLALCVNFGDEDFWAEDGIDEEIATEALSFLSRLLPMLHPASQVSNPIHMSDLMTNQDEIIYAPLMFGYVPYARTSFVANVLTYTNIPSSHSVPKGGVLGGVGLAISAFANHTEMIGDFLQFVAGESFQKGSYFHSGGQPGHRKAWLDSEVNKQSNHFFMNTLNSIDHSYLRPRFSEYPSFQEASSLLIYDFLKNGGSAKQIIRKMNGLYRETKLLGNRR